MVERGFSRWKGVRFFATHKTLKIRPQPTSNRNPTEIGRRKKKQEEIRRNRLGHYGYYTTTIIRMERNMEKKKNEGEARRRNKKSVMEGKK